MEIFQILRMLRSFRGTLTTPPRWYDFSAVQKHRADFRKPKFCPLRGGVTMAKRHKKEEESELGSKRKKKHKRPPTPATAGAH
jgi:hypothetical protein